MSRLHTLMFVFAMVLPAVVQAQQAPELVLADKSDVRIIVDISGSMKGNDPDNLRQPAVRLLAEMLPEGSMAGLWTFGQYVNMLVPHRQVTEEWRSVARDKSAQINSVALRTNLGKAIEVAGDGYYTGGVLENTHFILLTDGKVDVSQDTGKNQQEERRILETLVPELAEQGATFHPIALSAEADSEFLKQLALQSGGRFQVAVTAEALSRAFLEALNAAVPQEQIPIEGDGFTVDDGVSEFTALVFWGEQETRDTRELTLERPDGSSVALASLPENVRWNREAGYDLMTITEPMPGRWRIEGELGEGSRVTVVSDLRMAVSPVPARFSEEMPIDLKIAFYEEGEKITDPDFLQVLDIKVSVISEDGRSGTKDLSAKTPLDGMFTDTIGRLPEDGVYQIEVVADGQTFGRKFSTTTEFTAVASGQPAGDLEEAEVAVSEEADSAAEQGAMPEESAPEPDSGAEAEPEAEPASVNDISSPIDVSEVETPEISEAPETEVEPADAEDATDSDQSASPMPMWVFGAGAGGIGLMALVWLALRKKQAKASDDTDPTDANEPKPLVSEEPEAPEEELEEDLEEKPDAAVVSELENDEASDDIPETTEELDTADDPTASETDVDEVSDEEIPIAETVVPKEVGGEEESEEPVEAPILQDAESDEEEFGLDDFDLSEFDDLPGHSDLDSDQSDDQRKPDADDQDQKK